MKEKKVACRCCAKTRHLLVTFKSTLLKPLLLYIMCKYTQNKMFSYIYFGNI